MDKVQKIDQKSWKKSWKKAGNWPKLWKNWKFGKNKLIKMDKSAEN